MSYPSEVVSTSISYTFVKEMVDQLTWAQRARLKQEIDLSTTKPVQPEQNVNNANQLTGREKQVLALIADGLTRKEVGVILKISHNTVSCHVAHIYEKLQISTIAEATRAAIKMGMMTSQVHR